MTRGKKNERGASAVEYGLMIAGGAVALLGGLQALGVGVTAAMPDTTPQCGTVNVTPGDPCRP